MEQSRQTGRDSPAPQDAPAVVVVREHALAIGYEAAVEELIQTEAQPPLDEFLIHRYYVDVQEGRQINSSQYGWIYRMINTRRPLEEKMALLHIDPSFASRYVNDGFSGGEKKRLEMLQMAVVAPRMAILDETDSGLDIDALRNVAEGINASLSPEMGVLLITHYQRMLNYVKPQVVHVLLDGRVVLSGGELSHQLEANGYDWVRDQLGLPHSVGDEASDAAAAAAEPVAEHV